MAYAHALACELAPSALLGCVGCIVCTSAGVVIADSALRTRARCMQCANMCAHASKANLPRKVHGPAQAYDVAHGSPYAQLLAPQRGSSCKHRSVLWVCHVLLPIGQHFIPFGKPPTTDR